MPSFLRRLFGGGDESSNSSSELPANQQVEFSVGDRVRDAFGNQGTVTEIDPAAEHGLGVIKVKMADGRETSAALIASGLEKIDNV